MLYKLITFYFKILNLNIIKIIIFEIYYKIYINYYDKSVNKKMIINTLTILN